MTYTPSPAGLFTFYRAQRGETLRGIVMDYYHSISGHYLERALEDNAGYVTSADEPIAAGATIRLRNFGVPEA